MGSRGLETLAPNRSGYTPVNLVQRNGQYYNYTPPAMGNPMTFGPRMAAGKINPEAGPQGSYTPINFGGGSSYGGGRYGSARPYGSAQRYTSPSSSYRAPATYSQPSQPQGGKGGYEAPPPRQQPMQQGGKGGYETPPPRQQNQVANLYKPNKSGAGAATSKVPSFDPKNPQDDAIKDPKLRKAAKQLNKQAPPGERLAFINPKEEVLLKAVGGSGMTAAGGIPSYKKGDIEAPPPRDYGQETRDTLEAQIELAPDLYESEAQFRPQYANLERGIMLENLGLDPRMGLLDAFRQISGAQKDIQYDSTLADINMIGGLGQEFADAVRSADPRAEALRQSIMGQAEQGLATGDQDFSDIAEAQRERLVNRAGDYQPLMDRASAGLEGGAEYDALVNEAQQARGTNPFDSIVATTQGRLGQDAYSDLANRTNQALDADPYSKALSTAESALGADTYSKARNRAEQALDNNMMSEVTAQARSALGANPFNEVNEQLRGRVGSNPYDAVTSRLQSKLDANPYAGLVRDAQEDYASGEGLSAIEQRDLDQQVLAGAASRGMEDSAGTLAEQIGQRLSGNRQVRNQRRDALSQALGMSDAYNRTATQDFTNALGLQSEYGRQSLGDLSAGLGQASAYDRGALSDLSGALGAEQASSRQALNDYTNVLGAGEQSSRAALSDYTGTIGDQTSYQRGALSDSADITARQQDAGRTQLSDYSTALGQQEGYGDRGLNRYLSSLGQREDFGRRMEQDYAGALSGRMGLETALMGDYERALTNQQAARQQGLQNAGVAFSLGNFDPLLALTGRSGTAPAMAQQGFGASGFALNSSPGLFNPESAYAGALAGSNQQNIMDARVANASNRANMIGGLLGGLGSLGGGFLAGR